MRSAIVSSASLFFAIACGLAHAGDEAPNPYVELMNAKAPALVQVKFVLKSAGGRGRESSREVAGVMVDKSGLVMVSGTHFGGGGDASFQSGRVRPQGGRAAPSNFKVVFPGDEKEYEAVLGATDSNLRLSFVRIKDLGGRKVEYVAFDDAAAVKIGVEVVAVERHGKGFDYAPSFSRGLIAGEIRQPRPMWIVSGRPGTAGLPLFDLSGKTAGVLAMQQGADGSGGGVFLLPPATVKEAVAKAVTQSEEALKKAAEAAKEGEEGEGGKEGENPPGDGDEDEDD